MAAQGELQQLQTMPGARVVAAEAQEQITGLLKIFARDDDTVDDRRAVQHHLRRMGLRVHIDGDERQLGLQVGDGQIDWQPLNPWARKVALEQGWADPALVLEAEGLSAKGAMATVWSRDGKAIHQSDPVLVELYKKEEEELRARGLSEEEIRAMSPLGDNPLKVPRSRPGS